MSQDDQTPDSPDTIESIAIIGMAGRFPGRATWTSSGGTCCAASSRIRVFTDEELRAAGRRPAILAEPDYVRAPRLCRRHRALRRRVLRLSARARPR